MKPLDQQDVKNDSVEHDIEVDVDRGPMLYHETATTIETTTTEQHVPLPIDKEVYKSFQSSKLNRVYGGHLSDEDGEPPGRYVKAAGTVTILKLKRKLHGHDSDSGTDQSCFGTNSTTSISCNTDRRQDSDYEGIQQCPTGARLIAHDSSTSSCWNMYPDGTHPLQFMGGRAPVVTIRNETHHLRGIRGPPIRTLATESEEQYKLTRLRIEQGLVSETPPYGVPKELPWSGIRGDKLFYAFLHPKNVHLDHVNFGKCGWTDEAISLLHEKLEGCNSPQNLVKVFDGNLVDFNNPEPHDIDRWNSEGKLVRHGWRNHLPRVSREIVVPDSFLKHVLDTVEGESYKVDHRPGPVDWSRIGPTDHLNPFQFKQAFEPEIVFPKQLDRSRKGHRTTDGGFEPFRSIRPRDTFPHPILRYWVKSLHVTREMLYRVETIPPRSWAETHKGTKSLRFAGPFGQRWGYRVAQRPPRYCFKALKCDSRDSQSTCRFMARVYCIACEYDNNETKAVCESHSIGTCNICKSGFFCLYHRTPDHHACKCGHWQQTQAGRKWHAVNNLEHCRLEGHTEKTRAQFLFMWNSVSRNHRKQFWTSHGIWMEDDFERIGYIPTPQLTSHCTLVLPFLYQQGLTHIAQEFEDAAIFREPVMEIITNVESVVSPQKCDKPGVIGLYHNFIEESLHTDDPQQRGRSLGFHDTQIYETWMQVLGVDDIAKRPVLAPCRDRLSKSARLTPARQHEVELCNEGRQWTEDVVPIPPGVPGTPSETDVEGVADFLNDDGTEVRGAKRGRDEDAEEQSSAAETNDEKKVDEVEAEAPPGVPKPPPAVVVETKPQEGTRVEEAAPSMATNVTDSNVELNIDKAVAKAKEKCEPLRAEISAKAKASGPVVPKAPPLRPNRGIDELKQLQCIHHPANNHDDCDLCIEWRRQWRALRAPLFYIDRGHLLDPTQTTVRTEFETYWIGRLSLQDTFNHTPLPRTTRTLKLYELVVTMMTRGPPCCLYDGVYQTDGNHRKPGSAGTTPCQRFCVYRDYMPWNNRKSSGHETHQCCPTCNDRNWHMGDPNALKHSKLRIHNCQTTSTIDLVKHVGM